MQKYAYISIIDKHNLHEFKVRHFQQLCKNNKQTLLQGNDQWLASVPLFLTECFILLIRHRSVFFFSSTQRNVKTLNNKTAAKIKSITMAQILCSSQLIHDQNYVKPIEFIK